MNTRRLPVLTVVSLLSLAACVTKARHEQALAEQMKMQGTLESCTKEKADLADELRQTKKRLSEIELRNQELARTNQLLAGKSQTAADREVELQKEILRLKEEQAKASEKVEFITETYDDLVTALKQEIDEGQILIARQGDRLSVNVADQVLFASGSAEVQAKGRAVLDKVVPVLRKLEDKRIMVEGHTDNVKIRGPLKKKYPTNWELSAARATQVVRYLQRKGVDPHKLTAVGVGEYRPVASNDTAAGRRKNRRIEIVLLPMISSPEGS